MTNDDADHFFGKLTREDKAQFLLRLAHELTIVGRYTYIPQTEELAYPQRLRTLNEIQHRLLAHCLALMEDNLKRYPDDVLLSIVLEHPEDVELERQVRDAFDKILERSSSAA